MKNFNKKVEPTSGVFGHLGEVLIRYLCPLVTSQRAHVQTMSIAWLCSSLWDLLKSSISWMLSRNTFKKKSNFSCCSQLNIFYFCCVPKCRRKPQHTHTHTHRTHHPSRCRPGLPARLQAFNMQQTNMAALTSCFHAARFLPAPTVARAREQRSVQERPSQTIRPCSPWQGSHRDTKLASCTKDNKNPKGLFFVN